MNTENQLIEKFQVEELEKRFEMGKWISSVKVGLTYEGYGATGEFDIE